MKPFYRSWKMEPDNSSTGFEFGIYNENKDWIADAARWHILSELFTGYISLGRFTAALKVRTPTDWRFYATRLHPTRG